MPVTNFLQKNSAATTIAGTTASSSTPSRAQRTTPAPIVTPVGATTGTSSKSGNCTTTATTCDDPAAGIDAEAFAQHGNERLALSTRPSIPLVPLTGAVLSAGGIGGSTDNGGGGGDGDDGDESVQVVGTVPKKPSPIENATLDSIVCSVGIVNPISSRQINGPKTTLQAIGDSKIGDIGVIHLRPFLLKIGIPSKEIRGKNKGALCDLLLEAKKKYEEGGYTGGLLPTTVETKKKKAVPINLFRLYNVMFADKNRPMLATRAKKLTKDDLTDGLRSGDEYYKHIWKEYLTPKGDNPFYDTNQFSSVLVCDPSIFDPSVEMQHMRPAIGKGLREHEIIQKKFEVSGTHTELIDDLYVISDSDFKKFVSTSDGEALYLNCFFNLYPEVIQAAVGTLPPGVFRESTDFKKNLCQPRHSKRPRMTKRDLKNEKVISALDRYNGIQASRAQAEIERSYDIRLSCANDTWIGCEKQYLELMKERRDLNKFHAGYLTRFSKNELTEEEDAYWTSIKNDIKIYNKLIFDNIKRSNAAYDHVLKIEASNPAKKKPTATANARRGLPTTTNQRGIPPTAVETTTKSSTSETTTTDALPIGSSPFAKI